MVIRFKFCKKNETRYLSHLDILRILSRSFARAQIKAVLSCGFNPKPRLTLSNPIPLGVQSFAEYADIELDTEIDTEFFIEKMNTCLPEDIRVMSAVKIAGKIKSLMSVIDIVLYEFRLAGPGSFSADLIDSFVSSHNFSSIYRFETAISGNTAGKKIFLLKIFGYAKIFNNSSNRIFKFNDFYKALQEFAETLGLNINGVQKTGVFIIKESKLIDPFEAILSVDFQKN